VTTHLERIETGVSDSIETSSLYLDVIRDLKRTNTHLTSIAYPVLKTSDEVPKTKWKRKSGWPFIICAEIWSYFLRGVKILLRLGCITNAVFDWSCMWNGAQGLFRVIGQGGASKLKFFTLYNRSQFIDW